MFEKVSKYPRWVSEKNAHNYSWICHRSGERPSLFFLMHGWPPLISLVRICTILLRALWRQKPHVQSSSNRFIFFLLIAFMTHPLPSHPPGCLNISFLSLSKKITLVDLGYFLRLPNPPPSYLSLGTLWEVFFYVINSHKRNFLIAGLDDPSPSHGMGCVITRNGWDVNVKDPLSPGRSK